ncbi:threonine synthase [bacterium]|nr:threonine synthase [bacterium]
MRKRKGLKCLRCGREYGQEEVNYNCSACSENLDIVYNYEEIRKTFTKESLSQNKDYSIWRYEPLLPVQDLKKIPPLQIGWTPLYEAKNLGKNLFLKDDGKNPSASFKDRASAIAIVRAQELGVKIVTGASTGNAGSSMACLATSLGIPAIIFVPQKAPKAKITQLLIFGAEVVMVRGTYDEAFDLCLEATEEYGWYNRNTGYNPYTREGKKTCAYEICEQLNWEVPDKVFVPVGDGNIISGIWKGFKDLKEIGFINRLPQLVAVQSELSNAIVKAVKTSIQHPGSRIQIEPVKATTIADSISVDRPRDGLAAVKAVQESKGLAVEVSDEEILEAIKIVARATGIFGEPAGVTSYAGYKKLKAEGKIREEERIVCLITGNGLKDIDSSMKVAGEPFLIEPNLEALKEVVSRKGEPPSS